MRKIYKRSLLAGTVVVAAVGVGATAWASGWLVTGGGTANASTSALKPIHAEVTVTGNIYPGRMGEATALVDNPNDFPVLLTGITPGTLTASKKTGGDNRACAAALTPTTITATMPAVAPRIDAGAVDQSLTIPIGVSPDLDVSCAGSTIKMSFTFSGISTV
jgi:hypothetical protein